MGRYRREQLQTILEGIPGVKKVYFQPPESVKLEYPCIIYHLQNVNTVYANDDPYKNMDAYSLMIIDRNPDSSIRFEIEKLRYTRFDRFFTASNLNHWNYLIYY